MSASREVEKCCRTDLKHACFSVFSSSFRKASDCSAEHGTDAASNAHEEIIGRAKDRFPTPKHSARFKVNSTRYYPLRNDLTLQTNKENKPKHGDIDETKKGKVRAVAEEPRIW